MSRYLAPVAEPRPDEEPDVDDVDEDRFGAGLCNRCGRAGHRGTACPTVTIEIYKRPHGVARNA